MSDWDARWGNHHTFSFEKSLHFLESLIMKPSNCSGAAILKVGIGVVMFQDVEWFEVIKLTFSKVAFVAGRN